MTDTTKARLRLLAAGLQTIQDNYGVTSAQSAAFEVQKGELDDIIENIIDTPTAPPITVADVTAVIGAEISELGGKIDALIALANGPELSAP